jgi:hypothetical protein
MILHIDSIGIFHILRYKDKNNILMTRSVHFEMYFCRQTYNTKGSIAPRFTKLSSIIPSSDHFCYMMFSIIFSSLCKGIQMMFLHFNIFLYNRHINFCLHLF